MQHGGVLCNDNKYIAVNLQQDFNSIDLLFLNTVLKENLLNYSSLTVFRCCVKFTPISVTVVTALLPPLVIPSAVPPIIRPRSCERKSCLPHWRSLPPYSAHFSRLFKNCSILSWCSLNSLMKPEQDTSWNKNTIRKSRYILIKRRDTN